MLLPGVLRNLCLAVQVITSPASLQPDHGPRLHEVRAETPLEQLEDFTKGLSIIGGNYSTDKCGYAALREGPSSLTLYYATACLAVCGLVVLKFSQAM